MSIHKSVDNIECYNCGEKIELNCDNEGILAAIPVEQVSGSLVEQECTSCGAENLISPSIEWQTWGEL